MAINNIIFSEYALEDYHYWQNHDQKIFDKINNLIENILVTPFSGIGKSEPLRFDHSGEWSRRINREHRLVYKVNNSTLEIIQCRYHY